MDWMQALEDYVTVRLQRVLDSTNGDLARMARHNLEVTINAHIEARVREILGERAAKVDPRHRGTEDKVREIAIKAVELHREG